MNNKKYHLVGLVNDPTYHGTWYFKPETKEDVDEHWNKYVACEIHDGVNMSEIVKSGTINAKTDRNINIGNDSINTVKQILND